MWERKTHFPGLHFPVLHFSTLEILSLIFQSCRLLFDLSGPSLVSHFPVLHFQSTRLSSRQDNSYGQFKRQLKTFVFGIN